MTNQKILIDPKTDVIINVDVQKTFMPGGGLPVAGGDEIVPVVVAVNRLFGQHQRIYTLDKHPYGHVSLASSYRGLAPYTLLTADEVACWTEADNRLAAHARFTLTDLQKYLARVGQQMLWPDHGIEGTVESDLHPALVSLPGRVICKGTDSCCDSYSGLKDNLGRSTGLGEELQADGFLRVFDDGLAGDYCAGLTALNAKVDYGFEVFVIMDAIRAVDPGGSGEKMLAAFRDKGIHVIQSSDLMAG